MARTTYTLTTKSVPAAPRSGRRGGAAASRSSSPAADLTGYMTGYMTIAEFERYFVLEEIENPAYDATAGESEENARTLTVIKALHSGLYSDGFISAKGAVSASQTTEPGDGAALDEAKLAEWMTANLAGYLPADLVKRPDLEPYATREWVTEQLAPYATREWVTWQDYVTGAVLESYATREWVTAQSYLTSADLPTNHVTTDTAQTVTAAKSFTTMASFTAGIRIGSATLTWDSAAGAVKVSHGLYSESFIAAKGAGEEGGAGSAGLDEEQLARYLSLHGYVTSSALTGYATQSWVRGQDYVDMQELDGRGFITARDLPTNHVTTDTAQTVTAAKTFAALATFTAGIRIGDAELTWDSANRALKVTKSIYSAGAISAKGVSVPIGTADGTVSLWGQSFDGTNDLRGNIVIDPEGTATASQRDTWTSGKNPLVQLVKGSRQIALNIGSSGSRGLWCGDLAPYGGWLIAYNPDTGKIQYLGNAAAGKYVDHSIVGQVQITTAAGTPPLSVSNSTVVANLNADMVDGKHATGLLTALSVSGQTLSLTVGGTTKTVTLPTGGTDLPLTVEDSRFVIPNKDGISLGTAQNHFEVLCSQGIGLYCSGDGMSLIMQNGADLNIGTSGEIALAGTKLTWNGEEIKAGGSASSVAWDSITGKPSTFTPSTHNHAASAITSGTLAIARIPTGTTSQTVALGNHTHSGYAASNHTHSGYLPTTISGTAGIKLTGAANNPCLFMYNTKFPSGYGMQLTTNDGLFIGKYDKGGILVDASGYVYACGPSLSNKKKLN